MTFPTADILGDLRDVAKKDNRLTMIVNAQWSTSGQLISDFGIGPWKKRNEEFVAQFQQAYWLSEQRIKGETVRILKAYPHPWQVFVVGGTEDGGASIEKLGTFEDKPSYQVLEPLLVSREGSVAAMDWVERAKREAQFNADSLQRPPNNQ